MENAAVLSNDYNGYMPISPRRITLDDCSADWLNSLEGRMKKSTFDTYRRIYRRNISPILGKKICEDITQQSAESVLESPGVPNGANSNQKLQLYFIKKAVAVVFRFAKTR